MTHATAIALERDKQPRGEPTLYRLVEVPRDCHLPALVSGMLDDFDGKRTLAEVCQRGQISLDRGELVVKKLTQLGILETVPSPERRQMETEMSEKTDQGFTPEEEAFFASEVEPIDECDEPFDSLGEKLSLFFSELVWKLRGSPAF